MLDGQKHCMTNNILMQCLPEVSAATGSSRGKHGTTDGVNVVSGIIGESILFT